MKPLLHSLRRSFVAGLALLSGGLTSAQSLGPHHSAPVLVRADSGGYDLTWHGEPGTAYFVEFSTDLISWEYLPFTHRGTGNEVPFWYECPDGSASLFLRLKWVPNAPLVDIDGDGAPDAYEVEVLGTDPLVEESWVRYFVDQDGDGIMDVDEYVFGLDPLVADDPNSENVRSRGPILITQSHLTHYYFRESSHSPGSGSGTFYTRLGAEPFSPTQLVTSKPLTEYQQVASSYQFPRDGDELSREDSNGRRWRDQKGSLTAPTVAGKLSPDSGYAETRQITQEAHMLKLPYDAEETQHYQALKVTTYDVQETLTGYFSEGPPGETERERYERIFGITESGIDGSGATLETFIIPQGKRFSNIVENRPEITEVPEGGFKLQTSHLIPLHKAPDVLRVNSDFDEGRIDPATGYAIPDCDDSPDVDRKTGHGNPHMFLRAQRDHLEGKYEEWEQITEDLHPGWFGVHPEAMDDHFWDGANVTISKLKRTDPDTGRDESGQVRFYATWTDDGVDHVRGIETYDLKELTPKNLVTGGVHGQNHGSVYGSQSQIPAGAQYWMEGVRPGKITLEWRIQKGDLDQKFEQSFLVETQQTEIDWWNDLRYMIKLQTHDDPVGRHLITSPHGGPPIPGPENGWGGEVNIGVYVKSSGFSYTTRAEVLSEYYDFYRQCWDMDHALEWAGAARAGVSGVVATVSDLQFGIENIGLLPDLFEGRINAAQAGATGLQDFQNSLFSGAYDIFHSMAWQHYAFLHSGVGALDYVESMRPPEPLSDSGIDAEKLRKDVMDGWELLADASALLMDGADLFSVRDQLVEGGRLLARYEQLVVAQSAFDKMALAGGGIFGGIASSDLAKPPIAGGGSFHVFHQGHGKITDRIDRWLWIDAGLPDSIVPDGGQPVNGPLYTWSLYPEASKEAAVHQLLREKAKLYSQLYLALGFDVRVRDDLEAPLKQ